MGKEQGNGRKKEAFKDWVRFVVTERDRAQRGRGGLLARDRGDGGLARGSRKGKEGRRVSTVCGDDHTVRDRN